MPVNVATGQVSLDRIDVAIPGSFPLNWHRHYKAGADFAHTRLLGLDWTTRYFCTLRREPEGGFTFVTALGSKEFIGDPDRRMARDGRAVNLGACIEILASGPRLIVQCWDVETLEVTRYCFDARSGQEQMRLQSIEDVSGRGLDLGWNDAGMLLSVVQRAERRALQFTYDTAGRVSEIHLSTPDEGRRTVCRYLYDEGGRLAQVCDAAEFRTRYEYDLRGRLAREQARDGGVFTYRYDAQDRCVKYSGLDHYNEKTFRYLAASGHSEVTNSLGETVRHHYLPSGQLISTWDETGRHRGTEYDQFGRIIAYISGDGSRRSFAYDAAGNRATHVDSMGRVSTFEFNDHHQIVRTTNAQGKVWHWRYDARHRVTSTLDPAGACWTLDYDGDGMLVRLVDPKGAVRTVTYDGAVPSSFTDWAGHVSRLAFDAFGRLTRLEDPAGGVTTTTYDARGLATRVDLPDGRYVLATYDAGGNTTSTRDAAGLITQLHYGPCGRLLKRTDANGDALSFVWASEPDWLDSIVNQRGEAYRFERDAVGRVLSEQSFDGRIRKFEYDDNGLCSKVVKSNGDTISIGRDKAGSVLRLAGSDGSTAAFAYDENGLLCEAKNAQASVVLERDAMGRILAEIQGEQWVRHVRDPLGNILRTRSSHGLDASVEYDPNSLWKRLQLGMGASFGFSRDARGLEVGRSMPGGAQMTQAFDAVGRLDSQHVTIAAGERALRADPAGGRRTELVWRTYERDAAAEIVRLADRFWGTTNYSYDQAGRLLRAADSGSEFEAFEYDETGNITRIESSRADGGSRSLEYGPGNRLLRAGTMSYEYDEDGRLVRKVDGSDPARPRVWSFVWNCFDQLVLVKNPEQDEWSYEYDAFGRRIRKRGPPGVTTFVWNGAKMIHEFAPSDKSPVTWLYEQFGFAPLATIQRGAVHSIVCDHLGTPREVLNASGRIAARSRLRAYGASEQPADKSLHMPFRFQGQYFDDETGLHYNFYRYYDPDCGRFIQQDLIRESGFENLYAYARNPIAQVDPFGLNESCPIGEKGAVADANFAQPKTRKDETFSPEGQKKYSEMAGRPIKTIDDLAGAIRDGDVKPSQLPVDYVEMNGTKLILNTRTSVALDRGGVPKSDWSGLNQTGRQVDGMPPGTTYNDLAADQLQRNKLPPTGSPDIPKGR